MLGSLASCRLISQVTLKVVVSKAFLLLGHREVLRVLAGWLAATGDCREGGLGRVAYSRLRRLPAELGQRLAAHSCERSRTLDLREAGCALLQGLGNEGGLSWSGRSRSF